MKFAATFIAYLVALPVVFFFTMIFLLIFASTDGDPSPIDLPSWLSAILILCGMLVILIVPAIFARKVWRKYEYSQKELTKNNPSFIDPNQHPLNKISN
jgi:hypothetical protein